MDLADWLLARIAEDEAAAQEQQRINGARRPLRHTWFSRYPARVLAECEAKRRIVAEHPIYRGPRIVVVDSRGTDYGCGLCHCIDPIRADGLVEANGYCETLLALALPYADHPDFDESWRP